MSMSQIEMGQQQPQKLDWQQRDLFPTITKNFTTYDEPFKDLDPHTSYAVRIMASYRTPPHRMYVWPADSLQSVFQTLSKYCLD